MKKNNILKSFIAFSMLLISIIISFTYAFAEDNGEDLALVAESSEKDNDFNIYFEQLHKANRIDGAAIFLSWCAEQSNISNNSIFRDNFCDAIYFGTLSSGAEIVEVPKAGDLIFYFQYAQKKFVHVGIMINDRESIQSNDDGIIYKLTDVNSFELVDKTKNYSIIYLRPNYSESDTFEMDNQKAMFFFKEYLNISCNEEQHPKKKSYPFRLPVDIVGANKASIDDAFAPFDCKCVYISEKDGNLVVFESLDPVLFANGETNYATFMLCHDNDIHDIVLGQVFLQGDVIYQTGNAGLASGNHIHLEVARGLYTESNSKSVWEFVRSKENAIKPSDVFFLYENTYIANDGKSSWIINSNDSNYIQLSDTNITMQDNVCVLLTATTDPVGQYIKWESLDESIVTVVDGAIMGVKPGTTSIVASTFIEGHIYKAICHVTVTTSQEPETIIGIVSGTPGGLAINSHTSSSPEYKIGRIPEGDTCIIFLEETIGNWYYVEYDGNYGYVYKKYIKIQ